MYFKGRNGFVRLLLFRIQKGFGNESEEKEHKQSLISEERSPGGAIRAEILPQFYERVSPTERHKVGFIGTTGWVWARKETRQEREKFRELYCRGQQLGRVSISHPHIGGWGGHKNHTLSPYPQYGIVRNKSTETRHGKYCWNSPHFRDPKREVLLSTGMRDLSVQNARYPTFIGT